MTPNDLDVLIHCHVCPAPHSRHQADAVIAAIERFLNDGVIKPHGNYYKTTEKGAAWLEMILSTPMPVYRDPRF